MQESRRLLKNEDLYYSYIYQIYQYVLLASEILIEDILDKNM